MPTRTAATALALAMLMLGGGAIESADAGTIPPEGCFLDIMLVLDRSGSMNGAPAIAARDGAVSLLRGLSTDDDQSGVYSFAEGVFDKGLSTDHGASEQAVMAPPNAAGNQQAQRQTMDNARITLLDDGRQKAHKIMLVLSDGVNPDYSQPAIAAKNQGIKIFSIAIGDQARVQEMKEIASEPKDVFFHYVTTSAEAQAATNILLDAVLDCGVTIDLEVIPGCAGKPTLVIDRSKVLGTKVVANGFFWGDGKNDGFNPMDRSVQHTYQEPGSYQIDYRLYDEDGYVYDASFATDYIEECPPEPPVANFACKAMIEDPLQLRFIDYSTKWRGDVVEWDWDFGDGGKAITKNATHRYEYDSSYWVTLRIVDDDGLTAQTTKKCETSLNHPPTVFMPNVTVSEGTFINQIATFSDPDEDVLSFTWASGQLPGSSEGEEARFTWQTGTGDAGHYGPIKLTVDDGQLFNSTEFYVTVLAFNSEYVNDQDRDGYQDVADNCPGTPNRDQTDSDKDGKGDACDDDVIVNTHKRDSAKAGDMDNDGVPDDADNCPHVKNRDQKNMDMDSWGDACDSDVDDDGFPEVEGALLRDNCPGIPNPDQADSDGDGTGDACDEADAQYSSGRIRAQSNGNWQPASDGVWGPILWTVGSAILVLGAILLFVLIRRK